MTDMNDPVVREIVAARVKLLFEKPFFGNMASRLTLVDASSWCDTAATDGRHLFYNREFIKSLDKAELLFLIGHEVLHAVYDHLGRRGGRDPKIWNMANDYIVNFTLVDEKLGTMPKSGLYDKRYTDEMSSEEVYELLKKNSVTIKMPLDMHLDAAGDSEDDDKGKGKDQQKGKGQPQDGDGDGGDQPQDGNGGGNGQKEVEVTVMGKDGPPKLTEEDLQKIRNEIRAAAIQTAQQVGAGKVPAGVRRLIDALTQPKMDWRSLLDAHIRSSIKDDYTFQRLSRRSWGSGMILPAQNYLDTVDIAVTIDMSGSITDEMARDMLSEVKGIMETFRDFRLRLWTFDTEVYGYKEFTGENLDEIDEYECKGGGGTLFECNWEFMKREGIEPERFIVFSDGLPNNTWGDPDYVDTLFVLHGTKTITAPFGITCYYDD